MTGQPSLLVTATVPVTLRGFLLPIAHHFRAKGWRVDGLARDARADESCLKAFDEVWDTRWSRNPFAPANFLAPPRDLRRIVQDEKYDIVHAHTPVAAFLTRYALRTLPSDVRPRVVYTAHGFHFHPEGNPLRNQAFLRLERAAGPWTDFLVVMNDEDEVAAREHALVPPERLRRMPGIGLDLDHYAPAAVPASGVDALRDELRLGPDDRLFVMAAEFNARKRHADALAAFARLDRPDAHLAFTSKGPLRERIERRATELGVRERVHFLGFRDDLRTVLLAADAVILPSEQEGLPRCVMEAFALERPVIATDIRGTRELMRGSEATLVPLGDVEAIAAAMRFVLERPEDARRLGREGRLRMAAYDEPTVLRLHEKLYAEALSE